MRSAARSHKRHPRNPRTPRARSSRARASRPVSSRSSAWPSWPADSRCAATRRPADEAAAVSTLIASYTSEAGGSERLLLDVAAGLPERPLIACPEGWLADRAREAGLVVLPLRGRSMHLRATPRDRLLVAARIAGHA